MKKTGIIICLLLASIYNVFGQDTNIKPFVEPLLSTTWGQDAPYYNMCPTRTNSSGNPQHCRVGCIACAMGQIMYYHQYPETGTGSKSYTFIVSVSANFGATHYDWENMLTDYLGTYNDEQVSAVATLLYHCGVAVGMIYGLSSSYTNTFTNIPNAFTQYFRYDPESIRYVKRDDYSKEEWLQMIYENLSEGLPVFYSGTSSTLGRHAFVIDGYNTEGKLHINWGWYGQRNGYYDIDLKETGIDFNQQQYMVIGIKPIEQSTAISNIPTSEINYTIYSIDGRKITTSNEIPNLQKGIYIINGKKTIIK